MPQSYDMADCVRLILILLLSLTILGSPVELNNRPSTTSHQLGTRSSQVKRDGPSDYPWADPNDPIHALLENEFKWLGWDKNNEDDKRDGQRIHQAFREWHDFAKAAANDMNFEGTRFRRWFRGGEEDPVPGPKGVKDTFDLMIDRITGKATPNVAKMVLHREEITSNQAETCDAKPMMNAYTIAPTGAFHFCRKGINLPLNSELSCDRFTESVSGRMKSVTMTLLHEMTHYDEIDGTGFSIDDAGGNAASKCFELDGVVKIQNAQNYAWFAADAYWSVKCNKLFKDPPPGTADMEDTVNIPIDQQPGGPKRALTITADTNVVKGFTDVKSGDWTHMTWSFFGTDYGRPIGCRSDKVKEEKTTQDTTRQLYPFGVYDFELFGEACQYRNNGHTTGQLICAEKEIECTVDPGSTNPPDPGAESRGNYLCGSIVRHPMFTCPY